MEKEGIDKNKSQEQNNYEPTISDLEWVFSRFRKNYGEKELSLLIKEILENYNNKTYSKTEQPKSSNIKNKIKKSSYLDEFKKLTKNKYFKKVALFISIYLIIYLVLNSSMYFERIGWFFSKQGNKVTVLQQEVVNTPIADSAPLDAGEIISQTPTLIIPKINVNVPIVLSDTQEETEIQKYLSSGVVRYGNTANPGQKGNSFIVGHSSGYIWDNNPYKYSFVLLDKLEIGDSAKIYFNGKKYVYEVVDKKVVNPTDVGAIKNTEEPFLTLMTCYPPGTTSKRLLVSLKQTSPEFIKPKTILKEKEIEMPKNLPTSDSESFFDKIFYFWR